MTPIERRKKNIEIFNNTVELYESHPKLKESIEESKERQQIIQEGALFLTSSDEEKFLNRGKKATVIISEKRSFEAAEKYAKEGKRVCVLNFASWTNPGGWVKKGSSAQEEGLCRTSTLYGCLSDEEMMAGFYEPHKKQKKKDPMKILHNDDIIYTPGVTVFKSDTDYPELLPESEWYNVDVITCAAPCLRLRDNDMKKLGVTTDTLEIDEAKLRELITSRIELIFATALYEINADVLILGAFGCGAFRNPPSLVAQIFNEMVQDFRCYFDVIEFSIYHRPGEENKNYNAFLKYIEK